MITVTKTQCGYTVNIKGAITLITDEKECLEYVNTEAANDPVYYVGFENE